MFDDSYDDLKSPTGFNKYFKVEVSETDIQRNTPTGPETKLMVEVIKRGILDWVSGDPALGKSAKDWFLAKIVPEAGLFSFQFICEALGLDTKSMVKKVIQYVRTARKI